MVEPFTESFVESRYRDSSGDIRPTIVWAIGNCKAVRKDDAEPVVRCIGDSMGDSRAVVELVVETMQSCSQRRCKAVRPMGDCTGDGRAIVELL